MTHPDPSRIGGSVWTRRTQGRLTRRERLTLLAAVATTQRDYLLHRVRRHRPTPVAGYVPGAIRPPDSRFAREVEEAAAEQNPVLLTHSYRSWVFGRALADVDAAEVDDELLFAGALLHDHGIDPVVVDEDFTLRSAQRAVRCARTAALDDARVDALEDGITVHTTPGITVDRDGALGYYIQNGAMVDIVGNRIWDIPAQLVDEVLAEHPRTGFTEGLGGHFVAEAAAVRGGRFSMLHRCGFVPFIRMAPFPRDQR